MKNQLSKREYKYRCKIIAENHLKKSDQRFLDTYEKESYKDLYCDKNKSASFKTVMSVRKLTVGICQLGTNLKDASEAFRDISKALQGMYEHFGCSIIPPQ